MGGDRTDTGSQTHTDRHTQIRTSKNAACNPWDDEFSVRVVLLLPPPLLLLLSRSLSEWHRPRFLCHGPWAMEQTTAAAVAGGRRHRIGNVSFKCGSGPAHTHTHRHTRSPYGGEHRKIDGVFVHHGPWPPPPLLPHHHQPTNEQDLAWKAQQQPASLQNAPHKLGSSQHLVFTRQQQQRQRAGHTHTHTTQRQVRLAGVALWAHDCTTDLTKCAGRLGRNCATGLANGPHESAEILPGLARPTRSLPTFQLAARRLRRRTALINVVQVSL